MRRLVLLLVVSLGAACPTKKTDQQLCEQTNLFREECLRAAQTAVKKNDFETAQTMVIRSCAAGLAEACLYMYVEGQPGGELREQPDDDLMLGVLRMNCSEIWNPYCEYMREDMWGKPDKLEELHWLLRGGCQTKDPAVCANHFVIWREYVKTHPETKDAFLTRSKTHCDDGNHRVCGALAAVLAEGGDGDAGRPIALAACQKRDVFACLTLAAIENLAGNMDAAYQAAWAACDLGHEVNCTDLTRLGIARPPAVLLEPAPEGDGVDEEQGATPQ